MMCIYFQQIHLVLNIRALRYENWTYAVYFSSDGTGFEYELYNLDNDPLQMNNLLYGNIKTSNFQTTVKLHQMLADRMKKEEGLLKECHGLKSLLENLSLKRNPQRSATLNSSFYFSYFHLNQRQVALCCALRIHTQSLLV